MMSAEDHQQLKVVREVCLASAESFLSVAERELGNGVDHICFHLAVLALEEVGKSILATINHMNTAIRSEDEEIGGSIDDHVKKIFWALWGGGMVRNETFTKEGIEQSRYLASTLHERRLESLYTDTRNPLPVDQRVDDGEARRLVVLARARLEVEKAHELTDLKERDIEEISWFFTAVRDVDRRKEIFSKTSLAKLVEVKSGREWIRWLRDLYRKNEAEMREYAQREMQRKRPEGEEAHAPKYRMRVRIQTPSHSIRNSAFTKWNEGVQHIKLRKSDRKDATKFAKGEMIVELTLPKGIHASYVWEHGLFVTKAVVLAFSVGTLGVFWWNVPRDPATYYIDIVDLEADPSGRTKLVVAPEKRLQVGFDDAKLVLDESAVRNVYEILTLFMREASLLETFVRSYALGLTLFSKTDIHLRLEVNAFEAFYKALKASMIAFGDWDGHSDFKEAAKKALDVIEGMKDFEKTLDLASGLETDSARQERHSITLTEVMGMKLYCDYYVLLKARQYVQKLKATEES